jgi:predicted methyltransferase
VALAGLLAPAAAQEGRNAWQRPAEVLDALGVAEGAAVADIGSGRGYFVAHLARRVGPRGTVYAVDVDREALTAVERLAERNGWQQVRIVHSAADDPRLPPASLDVALVVDTYHEFRQPEAMLEKILAALRPGGRLGVIDRPIEPGLTRGTYLARHRIPEELVREEAERVGFRFLRSAPGFVRPRGQVPFYFLIFEKPVRAS